MSPHVLRRPSLLAPLILTVLAGCQQDTTAPARVPNVHFAQGDNGVWTVNSLSDQGNGVCDDSECTLREAIAAATSGGRIVVASGLQGDVKLTGEQLLISKSMTIDGDGRIAVDAQRFSRVVAVAPQGAGGAPVVTLSRLTLKNGYVQGAIGGGLIVVDAEATLDNVVLTNNETTDRGGGIWVSNSKVTIRNSAITNNIAVNTGGGIRVESGTLAVIASTISGNQARNGGGIYTSGSTTVTGSTISGNRAAGGGGMVVSNASAVLRSSTIVKNTTDDPDDIAGLRLDATNEMVSKASLANTILGGNVRVNTTSSASANCGTRSDGSSTPTFASLGYNLIASSCFAAAAAGDVQITDLQVFTEVLEEQLKNNGGPTLTHALLARGRAVDVGYCPGETTDQRGFTRPVDDPTIANARDGCDIGAYELPGPVVAAADLMVSQTVDKTSVKQGDLLTYFVRVQNLGPQTAPNVVLNDVLSSGVTFVEARVNKGTVTAPPKGETGTVTWKLGDMLNQANEVVEIQVTVLVKGKTTITNTATVTGNVADPNKANDSAAITVSVAAGTTTTKPPKKP